MWLNLVERYPIDLALLINKKQKIILKDKENDMIKYLDDRDREVINTLDPNKNIIISTCDNNIDILGDGSFNITTINDIHLNGSQIQNDTFIFTFVPKIKYTVPKNILINFNIPYNYGYHTDIYPQIKSTTIDNYINYYDIMFEIHSNIRRIKNIFNIVVIKQLSPVINLSFVNSITNIDNKIEKIYIIKDSEVYHQFSKLF